MNISQQQRTETKLTTLLNITDKLNTTLTGTLRSALRTTQTTDNELP